MGKYEREEVDSEIQIQKAFKEPVEQEYFYSVSETNNMQTVSFNELSPRMVASFRYWSMCSWTLRRRL